MINPHSRSGASATTSISEALKSSGHTITTPSEKESDTDPNAFIKKHQGQADFVLVGGGDGSVNHLLPALVETRIPLIVFPLGTANNLARTYELPFDPKLVPEMIESGQVVDIDLGVVNGIYFLSVAGLGLSTEVNKNVPAWLKRYLGVLAFILTALKMAFKMNPFRATIKIDDKEVVNSKSWQISVCNGKYYGSGLAIKHNATLDDGKLHLLSTEVKSLWSGFALIPTLYKGQYKKDDEITLLSGKKISLQTKRKFKIDVDGDIKTSTPAEFSVIPKALKILIPKT
jgi:YegS/Rv2252/BmrU family lipid kinase